MVRPRPLALTTVGRAARGHEDTHYNGGADHEYDRPLRRHRVIEAGFSLRSEGRDLQCRPEGAQNEHPEQAGDQSFVSRLPPGDEHGADDRPDIDKPAGPRIQIQTTLEGNLAEAKGQLDELIMNYGLSGRNIVKQIHRELLYLKIPELQKLALLRILGKIDFRLSQGATEEIQLNALLAKFYLLGHSEPSN